MSGALGNYELSGSYQYIYQNFDAGGGAYSANDYYIEAYAASDTLIKIRQTWRDQKGGNPDENVGNLTATIQCATAINRCNWYCTRCFKRFWYYFIIHFID